MKSNKNLQQLIEVISALKKSEIDVAKKHLSAYNSNHTIHTNKMFQLFHQIVFKKQKNYEKLKKKISPESDIRSFNRLINRTLVRVEESLIVDVNLKRDATKNNVFINRFDSQKKLIQANILISKGLLSRGLIIVEKVITVTRKYELYDELIEALLLKIRIGTLGVTKINISKEKNEIIKVEKERLGLRDVRFLLQEYSSETRGKSNLTFLKNILKSYIDKMEFICNNINSSNAFSILYLANIEFYLMNKDYNNVIDSGKTLLSILNKSEAVYSSNRVIYVYNEISNGYLSLWQFNKTIKYSRKSIEMFKTRNNQYLTTIEPFIKANFYLNNFIEVNSLLSETLKMSITKRNDLWNAKFKYINAINLFVLGEFKSSYSSFNSISELEKDKEGWNVWFRTMRILCSVELMNMNLIDYDIESFRKFIQRTDKSGNIRERDKLILRVLLDLDRNNYDFKMTYENRREDFDKLESSNTIYSWDINSPEMIIFTEWFKAKINSQPYDHQDFFDKNVTLEPDSKS